MIIAIVQIVLFFMVAKINLIFSFNTKLLIKGAYFNNINQHTGIYLIICRYKTKEEAYKICFLSILKDSI